MRQKNNSTNRLILSIALFIAALLAAFVMSLAANQKEKFWIAIRTVPAGAQIAAEDVSLIPVTLSSSQSMYVSGNSNPVGSIARRTQSAGELIAYSSITNSADAISQQEVSVSMRSVDLPIGVTPGEVISLFQLHDAKNGEVAQPAQHVVGSAYVMGVNTKGSNFGGEVALTLSINRNNLSELLNATTSGRLIAVRAHG